MLNFLMLVLVFFLVWGLIWDGRFLARIVGDIARFHSPDQGTEPEPDGGQYPNVLVGWPIPPERPEADHLCDYCNGWIVNPGTCPHCGAPVQTKARGK